MNSTVAIELCIRQDAWLTQQVGHPVYQALMPRHGSVAVAPPSSLLEPLRCHVRQQRQALYYAKVDVTNVAVTGALQGEGFQLVDTSVVLSQGVPVAGVDPLLRSGIEIRPPRGDEHGEVLRIAASCFRFSRFHTDTRLPTKTANQIKREWIRNCLEGRRGDGVIVAVRGGRVDGFLAALTFAPERTAVIDLIGVDPSAQRRGAGSALVQAFMHRYADHMARLKVGTQLANIASLKLYQKHGFEVSGAAYVLHLHV